MNRTKVTFAFLALACLAGAASAQFIGKTSTYANLGACNGTLQAAIVTDADAPNDLGNGGGAYKVFATCASGSWAALALDSAAVLSTPKVTNVTVADDGAGTKPAGVTPITSDIATCTCNDATGCTMSVAEPTVASGYGAFLTIISTGTGNCEFADSAGVIEIGSAVVLEPTSVLPLVYSGSAWHRLSTADNVP